MTDLASLPNSVLLKIATLEQACIGLTTQLERSRKELQRLRIEARDLTPRTVYDEEQANRESERLIAEAARLDAAISGQIATCERQERRLRIEEAVIRDCKRFLHELPADARLRVADAYGGGNVAAIREQIGQVQDEISRVGRLPVPSADLPERIAHHVAKLAARAAPVITGIGDGEALRVLFPLNDAANRVHLTGFSDFEANPLLLLALVQPDRLAERLTQAALDGSISQGEREQRLHGLQDRLTALLYDEEASICAALDRGGDVTRSGSPPWAVLMVEIERERQAAAA